MSFLAVSSSGGLNIFSRAKRMMVLSRAIEGWCSGALGFIVKAMEMKRMSTRKEEKRNRADVESDTMEIHGKGCNGEIRSECNVQRESADERKSRSRCD